MTTVWLRIFDDLVALLHQFFREAGYTQAIVGLSGGFDSALVAAVACKTLGPQNVLAVFMPSAVTSDESKQLADQVAVSLGCQFDTVPIAALVEMNAMLMNDVPTGSFRVEGVARENLQARVRGTILMTLANKLDRLVLATSNLSETLTGYCTLYGDTVGAVEVIGCLFKTEAYEVGRAYNEAYPQQMIPEKVFTRKPTAELSEGQLDEDELMPYEQLDQALYFFYFQGCLDQTELMDYLVNQCGWPSLKASEAYGEIVRLTNRGAWKAKQCPPILNVRDLPGRPSWVKVRE